MRTKHDGGTAFPATWHNDGDMNNSAPNGVVVPPGGIAYLPGMTLRDYFAAAALTAMKDYQFTDIAPLAYRLADFMLAERSK